MQKKERKGRKSNNNTSKKRTNKNIKKRVTPKKYKLDNNVKLALLFASIALVLIAYMTMGLLLTIVTVIGIAIIIGIAYLLKKIKNQKVRKRIIIKPHIWESFGNIRVRTQFYFNF